MKHRRGPMRGALAIRDEILTAVLEIVAQEGWSGVTIRKIAERVCYSPPMIYEYFTGKEAIYDALVIQGYQLFHRYLSAATAGLPQPERRLQAAIRAIRTFAWESPEYYQAMHGMSGTTPGGNHQIQEVAGACLGLLGDALAQAMHAGILREQPPLTSAKALLAAAHGVISLHLVGRISSRTEAEALYDQVCTTLLAGWKA